MLHSTFALAWVGLSGSVIYGEPFSFNATSCASVSLVYRFFIYLLSARFVLPFF